LLLLLLLLLLLFFLSLSPIQIRSQALQAHLRTIETFDPPPKYKYRTYILKEAVFKTEKRFNLTDVIGNKPTKTSFYHVSQVTARMAFNSPENPATYP
jgi:hypothetical protein